MTKKINIIGANPKRINILDKPKPRIDPIEFANALNAQPILTEATLGMDPIAIAELGIQLLNRLRSTGGRPALKDATENCRVPLSDEDVKKLETIVSEIGGLTDAKPSVGQLISVIVSKCLTNLSSNHNTEMKISTRHLQAEIQLESWGNLFPSVQDLPGVVQHAKHIAECEMPLMLVAA